MILKSKTAKIVAGMIGFVMVAAFVFAPSNASAQTVQELQALIASLQSQIAALIAQQGGGSTSTACTFTRSLTLGSSGSDVTCLQQYLQGTGHFTFSGGATGYFGPVTRSAVAAWQAANGVSPAAGYFGPISQAKYAQVAGSPSTPTTPGTPSTTLKGGAGDIDTVEFISALNNEEVGENEEDVQVAGWEIEATQGSDIELRAVTLDFDNTSSVSGSDDDFEDYAEEVSVWFNGEEVARVDADTFDDDNNYRRSLTLDSGAIIRAGDTEKLVVAVSGIRNLDSGNATEVWNVGLISLRFQDAQNAVITFSSGSDMETTPDNDTTTDADERGFSFENFATAADLELKFSQGDDDINDARTIAVDDTDDTNNVEFFSFDIEAEGDSDIEIKDISFLFTSVGADVDDIINSAELFFEGKSVASENVAATTTVYALQFDDVDYVISAGDTVEAMIKVDINDLEGSFTEGDTLMVQIGEAQTNSSYFDAEDEEGNDLVNADVTGSATTDAHTFYQNGIQAKFVSQSVEEKTIEGSDNDYINLTLVFDITAFGQDAWIPNVATDVGSSTSIAGVGAVPTTAQGVGYFTQFTAAGMASSSIAEVLTSTADEGTNAFEIQEGQTERFTLKSTITNASTTSVQPLDGKQFRIMLTGINFASTDSATGESVYTSDLISSFKSGYGRMGD